MIKLSDVFRIKLKSEITSQMEYAMILHSAVPFTTVQISVGYFVLHCNDRNQNCHCHWASNVN